MPTDTRYKIEKRLIHRFVDKARQFDNQLQQGYADAMGAHSKNNTTESANLALKEREIRLDLMELQRDKKRFHDMGSVLPQWFIIQQDQEEAEKEVAAKKAARDKAAAKKAAAEKVKARANKLKQKMVQEKCTGRPSTVKGDKCERDDCRSDSDEVLIRLNEEDIKDLYNIIDSLQGKAAEKVGAAQKKQDAQELESIPESAMPEKFQSISAGQYSHLVGKYDPSTLVGGPPPRRKSLFREEDKVDAKFQAQERKKRDEFRNELMKKKSVYLEGEKLKKSILPAWLMAKQKEHAAAAEALQLEQQQVEAEEERKAEELNPMVKYGLQNLGLTFKSLKKPQLSKDIMSNYLNVLSKVEEKFRKDTQGNIDMGTTYTFKKDERRAQEKLEEVAEAMPFQRQKTALYISPAEMLNCGYLRLTKENVKRLEEMASELGQDTKFHLHRSEASVLNIFNEIDKEDKKKGTPPSVSGHVAAKVATGVKFDNAQDQHDEHGKPKHGLGRSPDTPSSLTDTAQSMVTSPVESLQLTPKKVKGDARTGKEGIMKGSCPDKTTGVDQGRSTRLSFDNSKELPGAGGGSRRDSGNLRILAEENLENLKGGPAHGLHGEPRLSLRNSPQISTLLHNDQQHKTHK